MFQTPRVDLDPLLSISSMVILKNIDVIVRTEHPKKHDKFKLHVGDALSTPSVPKFTG
jgi:hypothetical protein